LRGYAKRRLDSATGTRKAATLFRVYVKGIPMRSNGVSDHNTPDWRLQMQAFDADGSTAKRFVIGKVAIFGPIAK
jgi:hypothetical protein